MIAPSIAVAIGSAAVAAFKSDFPGASVVESPAGGRLTHASAFEARDLGNTPEAAARAFLRKYAAAFGVGDGQELVVNGAPAQGRPGPVRFERRVGGLTVFDGWIVVGVDSRNAVILVNAADVPADVTGHHRISRAAAIRAARSGVPGLRPSSVTRAARGWKAAAQTVRPAWRIDFIADDPPGDLRVYVDAENASVLFRANLRASKLRAGAREPERTGPR
jgi:hypothetical protein